MILTLSANVSGTNAGGVLGYMFSGTRAAAFVH